MRARLVSTVLVLGLAGCGSGTPAPGPGPGASTGPSRSPSPAPSSSASSAPRPGSVPPPWLGTRPLPTTAAGLGVRQPTPPELRDRRFTLPDSLPALPGHGFASRVSSPAPAAVIDRSTWSPRCPVAATDLDWVRLTFRGFDGRRHTGELLVNHTVTDVLVTVFERLYAARFPLEQMQITSRAEQGAAPTGDGNDTGAFNCRAAVGATAFSQHAYGLAVDVNPFQNPYLKGDVVLPELAGAYADRTRLRPGMILPGGPVVRAFAAVGWTWGGTWHSLKDLQHFSQNGS